MKSIGRELTEKGLKEVEEMDSNGNGKLEEGEVNLGEDSEGDDYSVNNNSLQTPKHQANIINQ